MLKVAALVGHLIVIVVILRKLRWTSLRSTLLGSFSRAHTCCLLLFLHPILPRLYVLSQILLSTVVVVRVDVETATVPSLGHMLSARHGHIDEPTLVTITYAGMLTFSDRG